MKNNWHEYYENQLTGVEKDAVDFSYEQIINVFEFHGVKTSNDDRAEELVSAITKYLVESKTL